VWRLALYFGVIASGAKQSIAWLRILLDRHGGQSRFAMTI
jgi:hypothetical protein